MKNSIRLERSRYDEVGTAIMWFRAISGIGSRQKFALFHHTLEFLIGSHEISKCNHTLEFFLGLLEIS